MARRGNRLEREIPTVIRQNSADGNAHGCFVFISTGSGILFKRTSQRAGGACKWKTFTRFAILYCIDKGVPEIRFTQHIIIGYHIIPVIIVLT